MTALASEHIDYTTWAQPKKSLQLTAINRVLVVEDDISLTNLLTSVLMDLSPNIIVDWATSGEEAEKYLEMESEVFATSPYDLIIADIFLDGNLTGLDLWKICESKYPDTNILVTSSLPIEKFVSCLKNEYACPQYLPKPFSLMECRDAIGEFLK